MSPPLPNPWPPTAPQVAGHLSAHTPVARPHRRTFFLIALGGVLMVVLFGEPSVFTLLLPWVLLGGLLVYITRQRKLLRDVQVEVQRAGELTMLRHHHTALERAWRAVPRVQQWPQFHAQAAMLVGANLLALRCYESGIAAGDYLLGLIPPTHPVGQVVSLQRAAALLHEDRLTDADEALRKTAGQELNPLSDAMLAFARAYQQVKTHQVEALVERPEALPVKLRPLGFDAGHGYGLVAAAMRARGDEAGAMRWWKLATLLLPAPVIMNALPETRTLAALPPAQSLANALEKDRRG